MKEDVFPKANGVSHLDRTKQTRLNSSQALGGIPGEGCWHGHTGGRKEDVPRRSPAVGPGAPSRPGGGRGTLPPRSLPGLGSNRSLPAPSRTSAGPAGPARPRLNSRGTKPFPPPQLPLSRRAAPGFKPSRSSSSSPPPAPALPGWSRSPGPGQSPPSIIHARAAPPPPPPPRRSEAAGGAGRAVPRRLRAFAAWPVSAAGT